MEFTGVVGALVQDICLHRVISNMNWQLLWGGGVQKSTKQSFFLLHPFFPPAHPTLPRQFYSPKPLFLGPQNYSVS